MTFRKKPSWVQSHCVFGSKKQMDLLKLMVELDTQCYLILRDIMQFIIGLNILKGKKVVLQIVLIIILQESELIHIILYLRWCRARDLFGSQIPVTTGGFEMQISCIRSSFLNHQTPSQFETWVEVELTQQKLKSFTYGKNINFS